jgi:hypothetical protein
MTHIYSLLVKNDFGWFTSMARRIFEPTRHVYRLRRNTIAVIDPKSVARFTEGPPTETRINTDEGLTPGPVSLSVVN